MGGTKNAFQATHWSEIRNARTHDEAKRRIVIDTLIRKYWKPIYCYLRHKGYENDPAKDLTQGFFHEIVLGRNLVLKADEAKGRFRTFMLTALDNYITSIHRANVAAKRKPKKGIVSLEDFNEESISSATINMKPDDLFTYVWASVLLDDVLKKVRESCFEDGKGIYWEVFRARVLDPIMLNKEPVSVIKLCKQFGIKDKAKVSNMIVTVKRRFNTAMSNQIRQHVDSDEEVDQEIQDLMEILSKNRAS